MLVLDAIDEAAQARVILQDHRRLERVANAIRRQVDDEYQRPNPDRDVITSLLDTIGIYQDSLFRQRESRPLGEFSVETFTPPLGEKLRNLQFAANRFLELEKLRRGPRTRRTVAAGRQRRTFDLDDLRFSLELGRRADDLLRAYGEADAVIEAWEAFAVPFVRPQTTHLLVLRFAGPSLTIPQCVAWLTFLDGAIELSFASVGRFGEAASVTIERLETGSIAQTLKELPEDVLHEFVGFIRRGFNREEYAAKTALLEMEGIEKAFDLLERLAELVNAGVVTTAEAEGIKRKLMAKNRLPIWDKVVLIEINGRVVAQIEPPEEATQRALPEGPSE